MDIYCIYHLVHGLPIFVKDATETWQGKNGLITNDGTTGRPHVKKQTLIHMLYLH